MKPNRSQGVIEQLWQPTAVQRLARELADIAAKALTVSGRPVRRPRADRLAAQIIQRAAKNPDLV
ncbi:MAG TPA: hypothetical protein VNS62_01460, partial [Candidatus Udaeobacter sp.]|nr:hypothetical protein [Candidatus Udaeobacter sp.]